MSQQESPQPISAEILLNLPSPLDVTFTHEPIIEHFEVEHGIVEGFQKYESAVPQIIQAMEEYRQNGIYNADYNEILFPAVIDAGNQGDFIVESVFLENSFISTTDALNRIIETYAKHLGSMDPYGPTTLLPYADFGEPYLDAYLDTKEINYFGCELNDSYLLRMYQTQIINAEGDIDNYWTVELVSKLVEEDVSQLKESVKNPLREILTFSIGNLIHYQDAREQEVTSLASLPDMFPSIQISKKMLSYLSIEDIAEFLELEEFHPKDVSNSKKEVKYYVSPHESTRFPGQSISLTVLGGKNYLFLERQAAIFSLLEKYKFKEELETRVQQLVKNKFEETIELDPFSVFSSLLPEQGGDGLATITGEYLSDYADITKKFLPKDVQKHFEKWLKKLVDGDVDVESSKIRHFVEKKDGVEYIWKVGIDPFLPKQRQLVLSRKLINY